MGFIKGVFTVIGAIVVLVMVVLGVKYGASAVKMDPKAMSLYMAMGDDVLSTGDPAKGMIIKRKLVIGDMTKEEAIENAKEIMDEIGEEYGLAVVDQKTMPSKFYIHIRSFCSPAIAEIFLTHSAEFIGFMPCRIGFVEDVKTGDIWLYTMNLDMMIHGGHVLPPELLEYAMEVKTGMMRMLEEGAANEE